jgi:hypothetical protein
MKAAMHGERRTMTPWVEAALGHLLYRMQAELWAQYRREPYGTARQRAILERMGAVHDHMCKVAARSQSPANLRMRLTRDGTLPDEPVIEGLPRWEWLPRSGSPGASDGRDK